MRGINLYSSSNAILKTLYIFDDDGKQRLMAVQMAVIMSSKQVNQTETV